MTIAISRYWPLILCMYCSSMNYWNTFKNKISEQKVNTKQMCICAIWCKQTTLWNFNVMKQTCIEFPPVDLAEEGERPDLVTGSVLEAEPLVDLFEQQTLTDGPGVLTELLWIHHQIIQDPLLHHLILHLKTAWRRIWRDEFVPLI